MLPPSNMCSDVTEESVQPDISPLSPLPSPRTKVCIENSSLFLDLRPNSHISMTLISNKQDLLKCTLLMKGQVNYYTCCFALAKDFKCLPPFDSKNKQKPSEAEPLFIYCICVHPSLFVLLTMSANIVRFSSKALLDRL